MERKETSELALIALSDRQHGQVTRQQRLALGLGSEAIRYRCAHGRLFCEHTGVYSVGRPARMPLERASAAVLACGPGAALSHQSALTLWALLSDWRFPLHVTGAKLRRRPLIITHRTTGLTADDIRVTLGIRATSPARTSWTARPTSPPQASPA